MGSRAGLRCAAALAGALALSATSPASSDECAPLIAGAADLAPGDAALRQRTARCLIEAERFEAALSLLESARADAPEDALLRAMALYHLGRTGAAETELARAAPALGERAELDFYLGMIHLARSNWAAAADRLDRARRIDPALVEPVASSHAARAWLELGDTLRAREALERVARDWPGTAWAEQSHRQLERLDARAASAPWLWLEAGMEGDDNVVLRGSGVQLPDEIADERDRRTVWLLHGGRELLHRGPWVGGAALTYSGAAHVDLHAFDSHYPSATLWLDRRLSGIGTARATYDFGYAWVDGDAFLVAHDASLGIFRGSRWGTSALIARAAARDYRFALEEQAHARNRDGLGFALGFEHALGFARPRIEARVRLEAERYDARGREYSFSGESLGLALRAPLPLQLRAGLHGTWSHRAYRHPSTYPDPGTGALDHTNRREDALLFSAELARPLGEQLTLVGRWSWQRNRSTSDVFDYRRTIFGLYLRLGPGESAAW